MTGSPPDARTIDIPSLLPHRYPFLLVDAFVSLEGDTFECLKNVTYNEPFFAGHFPGDPVMPGVLIVEALAQAGAIGLAVREGFAELRKGYLAGVEQARFRRPVVPGDQLRLTGEILLFRRRLCKIRGVAYVGAEIATEATLSFMYV